MTSEAVQPGLHEDNLPNTILEAMSCGTPVVAFEAELAASLEVIKSQELVPNRLPVKLLRRLKIV